jgi:hypothetical protein
MYLVAFIIILTIYAVIGVTCKVNNGRYKLWCETLLNDCDYHAPSITIMSGGKSSAIKHDDLTNYIYLQDGVNEDDNKRTLIYLLAHTVSGYKRDMMYYSAVDKMMEKAGVDRLKSRCV